MKAPIGTARSMPPIPPIALPMISDAMTSIGWILMLLLRSFGLTIFPSTACTISMTITPMTSFLRSPSIRHAIIVDIYATNAQTYGIRLPIPVSTPMIIANFT